MTFDIKTFTTGTLTAGGFGRRSGLLATAVTALLLAACGGGGGGAGGVDTAPTSGGAGSGDSGSGGSSGGSQNPAPGGGDTGSGSSAPNPVIYLADEDLDEIWELYLADATSPSGSTKLNGPLIAGGNVAEYAATPNGQSAIYTADGAISGRYELYMVNLASPGVPTKLNAQLLPNRDVIDFIISPDGSKVVYRADVTDNVFELFMVDVANPGVATQLSAPLVVDGWVRSGFQFSPDGSRVLYRADQNAAEVVELFTVNVATPGISQRVNPQLAADGDVYDEFEFSPDSQHIAYIADQDANDVLELYSVAVANLGTSQKLNGTLVSGGDVCRFHFAPDSSRVAYCADQTTDDLVELYTVALDTPAMSTKINPPLATNGRVTTLYEFGPQSDFIVYVAEQDTAGQPELYRAEIAMPGVATKLSAPLVSGGGVVGFDMRADGARISYNANQETVGVYELYEVDFASAGVATKLSAPMSGSGVMWFEYTTAGDRMVYLADQDSEASELYRVEINAPGVAAQMNDTLVTGGEVYDFVIVP
jgi:Tol biopolymer transport system component